MTPSASCAMQSRSWKKSTTNLHSYSNLLTSKPLASQLSNTLPTTCSNQNHARHLSMTAHHSMSFCRYCLLHQTIKQAASPLQHLAHQPAFQIKCSPCTVHGTMPLVYHPAPTTVPCKFSWPPPTTKTTIPNWEKPAVLPPATNPVAGMFSTGQTHWPPPQLERKNHPI